jgi:hypothetical protein
MSGISGVSAEARIDALRKAIQEAKEAQARAEKAQQASKKKNVDATEETSAVGSTSSSPRAQLVQQMVKVCEEYGIPPELPIMCALVESNFQNVHYGDRDSLGMFQQRDAWGSEAERMDPMASLKLFIEGGHAGQPGVLDEIGDYGTQDANGKWHVSPEKFGELIQDVQVSAFPDRYQERLAQAQTMLREAGEPTTPLNGYTPPGPSTLEGIGSGGTVESGGSTWSQSGGSAGLSPSLEGRVSGFRQNPWVNEHTPAVTSRGALFMEDLFMLAFGYGLTLEQLLAANPRLMEQLKSKGYVKPGTKIKLPRDNFEAPSNRLQQAEKLVNSANLPQLDVSKLDPGMFSPLPATRVSELSNIISVK